jgi:quinol monooxygenase YgiN
MPEPIVFISHQKIKDGKFDAYVQYYRDTVKMVEQTKPQTLANLGYANADGTEFTIVQVYADAEAMETHMRGMGDAAKKAFEFVQVYRVEVFGKPTDMVMGIMQQMVGSGVEFKITPQAIGGFMRLKSG